MSEEKRCAQCGAVLAADAPHGLCPACLLKRGFASGTGASESNNQGARTEYVPPPPGELARHFPELEILELVGRGGMGVVYKARQKRLDRLVALKILPTNVSRDAAFSERFSREAKALARLTHPNIVTVHDFGQTDGLFYFVMEFVDGMNLRQLLDAGKLSPKEALAIVPQICDALQYAHDKGIVHRDIKPENILLGKDGAVKIADFGLAKLVGLEAKDLTITSARDVIGTPLYMAPEQIEHPQDVDHRADIYSLGVVFYQMLTGELPIGRFAPPSRKVQVDVRLDEVVLHALEKEPQRRYQQASQVKTAVETIAGTPTQLAAPSAGRPLSSTGKITAPAVALMVAALWKLFSALVALVYLTTGTGWLDKFLGLGNLFGSWGPVAITSIVLFRVIPGVLIMFGGFQMLQRRSYAWAIAAGIISIVSCSLIGFPIGIWALIVLARNDVKLAFGSGVPTPPSTPQLNRFWQRFAVVAGCLVLILIAIAIIGLLAAMFLPSSNRAKEVNAQQLEQAGIHQDGGGEFRRDFSQSFPFNADGHFSLDHVKGRIEICGWSSNAVVIAAAIHGKTSESVAAVSINIDSGLDRAIVHTEQPSSVTGFPWSWLWFKDDKRNDASVDYTIQVPQRARLGDISSVNGHIVIDSVLGDIAGSTVNGDTQIKDAARNLKLSTVNGRIAADMVLLGGGQSVSLNAVNGEIELALPDNADAKVSASTVNGSITSEFPSLTVEKQFPIGNSLKGSLGNGSATVHASAVNGTINILENRAAKQTAQDAAAMPQEQALAESDGARFATTNFYVGQMWFPKGDSIEITSVNRTKDRMVVKGNYNLFSHDGALLALYITSTNKGPEDAKQRMEISKGAGDFELMHSHLVPGLPHVSMYADGHPFAALYFGTKAEALEESQASWITSAPPASANAEEDPGQTVASSRPVVVETQPSSGARDVEPGIAEICVRFSKEMTAGSWSWSTAWENSTPEFITKPRYEADGRTCVAKMKLEPGQTYAFWLNSEKFQNFTDKGGRPAVPYLLTFQTRSN